MWVVVGSDGGGGGWVDGVDVDEWMSGCEWMDEWM